MSAPAKSRAGGVLPINAAATRKASHASRQGNRTPGPKLRLIVRRLPPGLVESEFWGAIGEDWQLGKGKIEWAAFKDGKVSKDPAKPSRPARAYLKVKDQTHLDALSAKVRATSFQDARNTTRDPCLLGPPSLEFAPYNKMATARVRHDGRQGTIDQDQEFIDFLQSLTAPITKPSTNGADPDLNQDKITTTPLVQYLKEKKANKAKEAAEKKSAKQRESKDSKDKKASTVVVKGSTAAAEKARVAKATQDAVKAINKSVASMQTNKPSPTATKDETNASTAAQPAASSNASPAKRERERGNATAAARMLQRDLGLTPRSPRGARATSGSPTVPKTTPVTTDTASAPSSTSTSAAFSDTKPTSTPVTATPPTGPKNNRTQSTAAAKSTPARPAKSLPNPSTGAKSAFLKHANPSQGVTEDLLRAAFEAFGTLSRCEIDKKKGLGYVDFEDSESLKKAMHASPVKVGNGQVVVLENRNVKRGQQAQGGATSATSTPNVQSPVQKSATPALTTPAAPDKRTASPAQTAAMLVAQNTSATPNSGTTNDPPSSPTVTVTPPTAPRGGARGGGRGSMRGNPAQRGNFGPGARSTSRGGFRGGRGSFGPRSGRAAAQAVAAGNDTQHGTSQNIVPAGTATDGGVGGAANIGGDLK